MLDRAELLNWGIETGIRWWLLHPSSLRQVKGVRASDDGKSAAIFRAIQQMIMARNPLDKGILLPDGTEAFPRDEMPAVEMRYLQCRYPDNVHKKVVELTTNLLMRLPSAGDIDDGDGCDPQGHENPRANDRANEVPITPSKSRHRSTPKTKQDLELAKCLQVTIHRLLWFLAIEIRAFEIAIGAEDRCSSVAALQSNSGLSDALSSRLEDNLVGDATRLRDLLKEVMEDRQHKSPGPKLDAGHVESIADQHPAGGVVWLYTVSRELP